MSMEDHLLGLDMKVHGLENHFWRNSINTFIICFFVVCTSLTIGTFGGYALSRSSYQYTFWLLVIALIFRAMPPITLVAGYMLPFFEWNIWGILPTTIVVLVAINQPFTLWMLHSFFQNIPKELDESAKVDGCTQFEAFRFVIIPAMWPGVITTGLFSFLLAYNDFAVTSMLLSENNRTMVPAIAAFLGTTYTEGNIMFAGCCCCFYNYSSFLVGYVLSKTNCKWINCRSSQRLKCIIIRKTELKNTMNLSENILKGIKCQ